MTVKPRPGPQQGKERAMSSCACGTCKCEGKAVVEQDEYDGLVNLASSNIELRDAAIQLVNVAKEQELPGLMKVWVARIERALR